jgi:hypothetical protein
MIIDTGSDVSIIKPGVIEGDLETSPLKPFGVNGEDLEVLGQLESNVDREKKVRLGKTP